MASLAWGQKVEPDFCRRVIQLGGELGCDPSWLMACMAFETGETFDPAIRNATSGATGLIQFMPSTAAGLGTSTDELAAMPRLTQLEAVAAYFRPFTGKIRSLADCYMCILWPAAVSAPDDQVIFAAGSRAYLQNRGLDLNHDNAVTKAECAALVQAKLDKGMQFARDFDAAQSEVPTGGPMGAIALPLLQALLPQVLGLFSGKAQAQISKATGADPAAAGQFMQSLINQIGTAVGVPITDDASATKAVAAVHDLPPEKKTEVVAGLESYSLEQLAPILDKLHGYSKDEWAASDASVQAARVANAEFLTPEQLRSNPAFLFGIAILALVAFVVASVMWKDAIILAFGGNLEKVPGFSTDMQAFVIGAIVGSALTAVIQYFYGSNRQSAAKDAAIKNLSSK